MNADEITKQKPEARDYELLKGEGMKAALIFIGGLIFFAAIIFGLMIFADNKQLSIMVIIAGIFNSFVLFAVAVIIKLLAYIEVHLRRLREK